MMITEKKDSQNQLTKSNLIPMKSFPVAKQNVFFNGLKKIQFTGELLLISQNGIKTRFYLSSGRLICGTGGEHSVRRWRRNLTAFMPQIVVDHNFLTQELKSISHNNISVSWEYELLHKWLNEKRVDRNQVIAMVKSILIEMFFDLNQSRELTFHLDQKIILPVEKQIFAIDSTQVIVPAWQQRQNWISAKLGDRQPNSAPVIKSKENLQAKISPKTYQAFVTHLNGKNTLRDLALQFKKDLVSLGSLLLPYIQTGYVELVSIPDLPTPLTIKKDTLSIPSVKSPLIACIDDSEMICKLMKSILEEAGFRYLGVNEPLKAIPSLLAKKPDFIFLDLEMPHINGFEICTNLRKLSLFQQTPIVILTGNDGMLERVRSKMIGCTDFLGKPVEIDKVLNTINKYLPSLKKT